MDAVRRTPDEVLLVNEGLDTYSAHQFRLRVRTAAGTWGAWSDSSGVLRTASICGDGRRHGSEGCDDGNQNSGDGCSLICKPEAGFSCSGGETGGSDTCEAGCGDGLRAGAEECDAQGESAGCNDACRVVMGWSCVGGTPTSKDVCTATCGDGVLADGAETCDDGNSSSDDGCSASCAVESGFVCTEDESGLSTCQNCGNGKREGVESCDDAGATGGCNDECSGIDAGWVCSGGSASSPDVCVGGPVAPTVAPVASLITSSSITYSWDAVEGNGLTPSYVLEYLDESAGVWLVADATTTLSVKLEDLRSNGQFRARVKAVTDAGESTYSPESAVATTLAPEEAVQLQSDSLASSELNGLMDNLMSGAATSGYLGDLGVAGFDMQPPPPPPVVPLEDDGSIEDLEELEQLLDTLEAANTTLAGSIDVPEETAQSSTSTGPVQVTQGEFTFSEATLKVSESVAGGLFNVTVQRVNGAFGSVSVAYSTADGTATAGTHYTAASGTLNFTAGQLEASFMLSVIDNSDFVNDPPVFSVTLSSPTGGASLGDITTVQVSILEDDQATLVSFVSTTATVSELAGSVSLSIVRSRESGADMDATIKLEEMDGAAYGSLFGGPRTLTVTASGSTPSTFTIPVLDGMAAVDRNRKFKATVVSSTNGLVGSNNVAVVSLTFVDCQPRGVCSVGEACGSVGHCSSNICTGAGLCASSATCTDSAQNQGETDVDCGGPCGTKCAISQGCSSDTDCVLGSVCDSNVCTPAPTCSDGIKNQAETDIDCGGPCATKCALTKGCSVNGDCVSGAECSDSNVCVPEPTCSDGIKNQAETDIDCGGPCATKCALTKGCERRIDCGDSATCSSGVCVPDNTCSDGVKNGGEADVDCGGSCSTTCAEGA